VLYGKGTVFRLPEGKRDFLKRLDQTDSVAHSPSYAVAAMALVPWVRRRKCEADTDLYLTPRLRILGAVLPHTLHPHCAHGDKLIF